jgi:hypothetical protein
MSLAIRRASLAQDKQQMVELLDRNITGGIQRGQFEWRHEANPAGAGWSWIIYEKNNGAPVAMASVFPRNMYLCGKPIVCGQVGDFVVDAPYRSLGPAVMLQRATFEPVNSGVFPFCYDCPPHDQGMSTFVRLGMRPNCEIGRHVLPLRTDEFVEKKLGNGVWTKPLVAASNLALKLRVANRTTPGLEIAEFDGVFDEEFSHLDKAVPSPRAIRASRSAADLNWRYRKNPVFDLRVLVARRKGELVGFLSYLLFARRASIVDVFGRDLAQVGITLLEAAIAECRRRNLTSLEGYCSPESELSRLFKEIGFRLRHRAVLIVAYAKPGDPLGAQLSSDLNWAFNQVEIMS